MKPKEALLLFTLLLSAVAFGQNQVIPQPPNRVLNIDGQWRTSDSRTSSMWDVVSDRNDNPVYTDASFSTEIPNFRLSFNETVYVLGYTPGVGLLVAKPNKIGPTGAFTGNASTEKGWVKEETMVLSRYSIRTRNNPLLPQGTNGLYTKKAFIFNKPGNYEMPSIYSNPSMRVIDVISSLNIYQLFYIYKEDGEKLLLGKKPEKNSVADDNLIGWMPRNSISSWNHNMCFEVNWNENAVAERSQRGNPALINDTLVDAIRYSQCETNFISPILFDERNDSQSNAANKRMDGNIFRSPIINTMESDKLYEVGYLSRGADKNMSESDRKNFVSCFSDLLDQLNTINLVFMIDGTHSIIPYKSTIVNNMQNSIVSLIKTLKGGNTRLKYSGIIYRDDPYQNRFSFMPHGMTTDYNQLITFVDTALVLPPRVIDDQPEAMFWGFNIIDHELASIRPFEKTFVIVIGDCGDHQRTASQTFFTERLVVDLLKRKNYSVSAIQINHRTSDPAYSLFQTQYKSILTSYYEEKHNVIIPSNSTECIDTVNNITRFPKKDMKLPSMLIYPPNGQSLSNEALGQQLTDLILAAPFADFKVKMPCKIPQSVLTYLNISTQDPDFMRKALYGLFNSYYVPGFLTQYSEATNCQKNSFRYFNDVQFFKNDELRNIDEQLKILIPDNNSPSTLPPRQRLYNAWKNILVTKLKVVDASEFGNTTLREASLFLTQNRGRDEWSRIKMMDINNLAVFPDNLLAEYYYDWFTTKIMVQSILGNSSKFLPTTLKQHSDVFKYCYDLFHPGQTKPMTVADRQKLITKLIDRSLSQHYAELQYNVDNYIHNYASCKGDFVTMTLDQDGGLINDGEVLKAFWVSGEYFPHENDYSSKIFDK